MRRTIWHPARQFLALSAVDYLARVQNHLQDSGFRVRSDVLMGKPADEIIDYAHKNSFNLIVMATHGRSGISRWEYGSVADKVLRGVSSPVFLVRPHLNIPVKRRKA
jgi:nucleotide-binding universal stress UspA family protein